MILFVNGSPQPNGNLHRMLEKIALDTDRECELIPLADLDIRPCRGCVGCAATHRCVQEDDMGLLYERLESAQALVVGGVVYFGRINALTHCFLERLFPLRHRDPRTRGKLAAAVVVGGMDGSQGVREIRDFLEKYFFFRMVGSVYFNSATPPCYVCGFGEKCQVGIPALTLPPEEFAHFAIVPSLFQRFEDHPEVVRACELLAQALSQNLAAEVE
ncbi:MAG: flavodoxin family protein [Deltaproteobacteria bacterium]|nr:flavodoxin family protein [Deltaproteobacteria bacterium]